MNKQIITVGTDEGCNSDYINFLKQRYKVIEVSFPNIIDKLNSGGNVKLDLILLSGGADVSPVVYKEKEIGKYTQINEKRDKLARTICDYYRYTPKLGICRGSQYLTALAGGKLVQHVVGHATGKNHSIDLQDNSFPWDGVRINITSTHHQMMFPYNLREDKYKIIAFSTYNLSNSYLNGKNEEIELPERFVEPEIVYYKDIYGLAIQGHPEFLNCPAGTKTVCLDLIDKYLIKNKI